MTEFRKVIKFGGNSAIMSLPKKWLTHNNILPGDSVSVEMFSHDLVISPGINEGSSGEEKTITHTIQDTELITIKRKILSAYIENYDVIILRSTEISKTSRLIREVLHQLMALEIIEESSQRIVAKCFLNMDDISIKNILRKTDAIIKTMMSDLVGMAKSSDSHKDIDISLHISERDVDVNRLTALIFRAIKYSLDNPRAKQREKGTILLDQWNLAHTLEECGDIVKRLSRTVNKLGQQQRKGLFKLVELHQQHYDQVMKAYFKHDMETACALELKNTELLDMADNYQLAFESSVHVVGAVQKIRDLSKRIKEISFLVS